MVSALTRAPMLTKCEGGKANLPLSLLTLCLSVADGAGAGTVGNAVTNVISSKRILASSPKVVDSS